MIKKLLQEYGRARLQDIKKWIDDGATIWTYELYRVMWIQDEERDEREMSAMNTDLGGTNRRARSKMIKTSKRNVYDLKMFLTSAILHSLIAECDIPFASGGFGGLESLTCDEAG